MRRPSLSTKLFAAALPLVVAVAVLLGLTVRSDLNTVSRAENGAELGAVWEPLIAALNAIEAEAGDAFDAARANADTDAPAPTPDETANGDEPEMAAASEPIDLTAFAGRRRATDAAVNELRTSIEGLTSIEAANEHITSGRSNLSAARRSLDMSTVAPDMAQETDPVSAYDTASRELVSVGQLLPADSDSSELGQELLAVVKLAEAKLAANGVIANTERWELDPDNVAPLNAAGTRFDELQAVLSEFQAIAPDEWATEYRQSGFNVAIAGYQGDLDRAIRNVGLGESAEFDTEGFGDLVDQSVAYQVEISESIVERANADAEAIRQSTLIKIAVSLAVVLLAGLIAWIITRSVTRRVKAVSNSANQVASEQLPALVEAIRDPRGKAVLPDIEPVDARGNDELAELASAFNSMQDTLVDVANEQVEVMRRGVSDIFVTMARRNRSLIDRQLAMLDEFEAEVDDADVLSNYYQLDHMATRMRRNSESLLVLANAEPKRRRVKATEIDDVVRAAIGEVEDYRRIEVEALESLQVRGNVVADISHMLAELFDNAASFSPPDSIVRVGGRRAGDSYMVRIVDNGVGIGSERLFELNELLRDPPIVGLSVEPTLGMSVVSLLANKHGIEVTLSAGNPGLTVDVILPSALFGPIEMPVQNEMPPAVAPAAAPAPAPALDAAPQPAIDPPAAAPTMIAAAAAAPLVVPEPTVDPTPEPLAPIAEVAAPAPAAPLVPDDYEPVDTNDWTRMSLDLSALSRSVSNEPRVGENEIHQRSAPVAPETATSLPQPTIEQLAADVTDDPAPAAPVADTDGLQQTSPPQDGDVSAADTEPALAPPPEPVAETAVPRAVGEFDRAVAPPLTANGASSRPVSPDTARPVPQVRVPEPTDGGAPSLPTRNTSQSQAPDGGHDRLAALDAEQPVTTSTPSALSAALSAFDQGRTATEPIATGAELGAASLPTRSRGADPVSQQSFEETTSAGQSRLDPDALRQRLRAFQSEFRTGITDADEAEHQIADPANEHTTDLGGDRR